MRRKFLRGTSLLGAGWLLGGAAEGRHRPEPQLKARPAKTPAAPPVPVQTPDLAKLEYTLENGVKVFELRAEVVECELMPASHMGPARKIFAWGYNGSVPGPMIEVVEGDRVRVVFTNKLPEPTTIHWHGLEIPVEMDGTPYISQPPIEPGGKFVYEFTVNQNGTFFYHSHGAMQEMMGMIGLFVIHPKKSYTPRVDQDYGIILQEWALLPNNPTPNTLSMEFNWLTMNGKSAPATTPLIIKQGERVRIRLVNLGMDHHPIHLHGAQFQVTGTEGGRIPESAWYPGNTVVVGVAQARDIEFEAKYAGDWMLHCHMPHHMMNQMVSMVGPMMMSHGGGSETGKGMEEGMGMLRQGHALSDEFGPGMGRGMGMTSNETRISNRTGAALREDAVYTCAMHPEVRVNQPGNCPKCGMVLVQAPAVGVAPTEEEKKKVPGYPQEMMMIMDEAVDKPETYGLAPGWTASMMGMMTLVRVLPEEKYNELMARIKAGRTEKSRPAPAHEHHH
ncbi:MAG TPA: multicopper oxidase domain-containing protein [Blastocatellia bacterium]|nr:multicopper oxidase domain-containing protein [Blastocatellia bacterium]